MTDSRDRMLKTAKKRYKTFSTPWGEFTIQSISEAEHRRIQLSVLKDGEVDSTKQGLLNAAYIQACLVEEVAGEYCQVWPKEEIHLIAECDVALTYKLMREIDAHCGFSNESQQFEDLEKNSEPTGGVAVLSA